MHGLVNHKEEYSGCKATDIKGMGGFRAYLNRKLGSKGGIIRERLGFNLLNMCRDLTTEN